MTTQSPENVPSDAELDAVIDGHSTYHRPGLRRMARALLAKYAAPATVVPDAVKEALEKLVECSKLHRTANQQRESGMSDLAHMGRQSMRACEKQLPEAIDAGIAALSMLAASQILYSNPDSLDSDAGLLDKEHSPTTPASEGQEPVDGVSEGAEIIENLIRNIESGGMYSQESTIGFLTQALYCIRPANPAPQPDTCLSDPGTCTYIAPQAAQPAASVEPTLWRCVLRSDGYTDYMTEKPNYNPETWDITAFAPVPAQAQPEVTAAAQAVIDGFLENVPVHPCDEQNESVKAAGLHGNIRKLYDALRAQDASKPAQGAFSNSSRESKMVVLRKDSAGQPTVWCDPEIATLIDALNNSEVSTVWSCSGHGEKPGCIGLKDGRQLIVMPDLDSARELLGSKPAQDEREAFEQNWNDRYHAGRPKAFENGEYAQRHVQAGWEAWQDRAALSTPPIDAPKDFKPAFANGILTHQQYHQLWAAPTADREDYDSGSRFSWHIAMFAERVAAHVKGLSTPPMEGDAPEPLHITHAPLIRQAIALLRLRSPVPSDFEQVASELEIALAGKPTPAGEPSEVWLNVAAIAAMGKGGEQS